MALGEHEPRLLDEDRVRQLRDAMDDAAREHMRVTAELLTYVMNRAPSLAEILATWNTSAKGTFT